MSENNNIIDVENIDMDADAVDTNNEVETFDDIDITPSDEIVSVSSDKKPDNAIQTPYEKFKNTASLLVWTIITIVLIFFVGQALLWRFAPSLWTSIFGVEAVDPPAETTINEDVDVATAESSMTEIVTSSITAIAE